MLRLLAIAIACLGLAGCIAGGGTVPTVKLVPGTQNPADVVAVKYKKPAGGGPFPAVVLLHGCGGWYGNNIDQWSDWFVARGYAALAVDSFGTRNIDSVCTFNRDMVTIIERVGDAYGALAWLDAQPDVDASRVVVMGFSFGGTTTVASVSSGNADFFAEELGPHRFRAGVALYPWCGGAGSHPKPYAPLVVVTGSKDTWTPPAQCLNWTKDDNGQGDNPVEVNVIPGAVHSFDVSAWNGRPVGARTGATGHMLIPDANATAQARRIVAEFLQRRAGLP